jgi:SAM-dependent methyltransferase
MGENILKTPETIERLQASVPAAFALLAGMQLDVFTHLADRPRGSGEIAAALGVAENRLSRLLYALVVAGLLERRGNEFGNTPEAAAFLVRGREGFLGDTHDLLAQLWQADLCTAQSIRSGKPAALHDFAASSDEDMKAMLRGMHSFAIASGRDLARRFDFSDYRSVVDIGGGSGGLLTALCEANPALHGTLFELPRNAALAADILMATPAGERVTIEEGDILAGPPRGTFDAAVMRALVQVLSPPDAARAIANAALATRPGGSVFILGGGVLGDDRVGPELAVFLNVTFMNIYPAGASHTLAEHAAWLAAAGCGELERITLPSGGSIIRAKRLD